MDAETIRLIITASVALIAGLGGAGVTAAINRRNTIDTLAASRLVAETQLRETQNREHAVWLRDQKQEAYTAFMVLAQSLQQQVVGTDFTARAEGSPNELEVARSRIKLIGTPAVRAAALGIENAVDEQYAWHERLRRILPRTMDMEELPTEEVMSITRDFNSAVDSYFAKRTAFSILMIEFVNHVRQDLGTSTVGDRELDDANRQLVIAPDEMDEAEKLANPEDAVLA